MKVEADGATIKKFPVWRLLWTVLGITAFVYLGWVVPILWAKIVLFLLGVFFLINLWCDD